MLLETHNILYSTQCGADIMEGFDHAGVGAGEFGVTVFLHLGSSRSRDGLLLCHGQSRPFFGDHAHKIFIGDTI